MTGTHDAGGRPLALITGASSGIGRAYAERLAVDGYDLVVVARRGDRLGELKDRHAAAEDPRIRMVVDSAALAYYMPFAKLPTERAEELVKLNVLAPVRLIHSALPGMIQRGNGAIISIASLLAFSAANANPQLPARAVYAASKSFLLTFVRLLAQELRDTGVRLQVVCPGVVKTEFHTRQQIDVSHMPRTEPEQIVQASMLVLQRGEIVCMPTVDEADRLQRYDQAANEVFMGGMKPALAGRYSG